MSECADDYTESIDMPTALHPTIVSMPLGFIGAVLGTLLAGRDKENEARFGAFSLRVHTGNRGPIATPEF
jgi:hypothetical protein